VLNASATLPPPVEASPKPLGEYAVAFVLLAGALVASGFPWSFYGMNWSDKTWYFHFGHRLLAGDFPYRDYTFQVGFAPIFWDALFQKLFGTTLFASILAGLAIKGLTLLALYGIFSAYVRPIFAALGAAGFAWFLSGVYNSSYYHQDLLIVLALLGLVRGLRDLETPASRRWLFLVGAALTLQATARQSTLIFSLALFLPTLVVVARSYAGNRGALVKPICLGMCAGLAVVAGVLALNGALADYVQQIFMESAEKKNLTPYRAVLELLSGGNYEGDSRSLLIFHAGTIVPACLLYVWARATSTFTGDSTGVRFAGVALAALVILGLGLPLIKPLAISWLESALVYDIPRVFFLLMLVDVIFTYGLGGKKLASEELTLLLCVPLMVGYVWSYQASWSGRLYLSMGWGTPEDRALGGINLLLALGVLLVGLHALRNYLRGGAILLSCFFLVALGIFIRKWSKDELPDFSHQEPHTAYCTAEIDAPEVRGIHVTPEKKKLFDALRAEIQPGQTLFIYGGAPALYTLLGAKNPTRLDLCIFDFCSTRDIHDAISQLYETPPDFILIAVKLPREEGFAQPERMQEMDAAILEMLWHYKLCVDAEALLADSTLRPGQSFDKLSNFLLFKRKDLVK